MCRVSKINPFQVAAGLNSERHPLPRPSPPVPQYQAANKRTIGRPEKDCYGLTTWLWGHLRGTAAVTHRGGSCVAGGR